MFEDYVQPIVDFARAHEAWAAPIVFALAFMESLAFISLLVPAWGALVLIGTVIGAGELNFLSPFVPFLPLSRRYDRYRNSHGAGSHRQRRPTHPEGAANRL